MLKAARSGGCPHWCFDPQGVQLLSGPNEFFYEWSTLDRVVSDDDLVVMISNRYALECIPTRFFKGTEDVARLLEFARDAGLPVLDYRKPRSAAP
ncbi:YcxB family protein [Luteolibacter ambystomatis]|uniref:YcxB family protein n=2 Tax=Luteolibacter ambystomatis TaxID=2824561 RepID=A0A975GA19_9BACT|nr:YcxB family protein [Luteolibacter ambystomatis]QUE51545.1 YcxB family protein [Luteolibacter ambystomatis]